MNIFLRELKANFRSLLIWGGIVILFVVVGFSKFSAFAGDPQMLAILDDLPEAMLSALNMNAFNLTTVSGFYGIMFLYFAVLLSVCAVMWGSDIIVKEERDKTVEFILTLPIRRSQLITGKALAAVVYSFVLLLITWGATLAGAASYGPDSEFYAFVALSMVALFILQLIFLAVGILLGSAMKRYKQAGSAAIFLLLATFFLSIILGLNDKLSSLKVLTPFKYFDAAAIFHQAKLDMPYVGLSIVIVVVCMIGAYWAYAKRDLYI
ncbi:MAG: ABC transporter permease subunit [Caldilineaceae bacterium]|nr:ABC transporter permease subunit [Caldilineaceae bacterium]MBP8106373.1 ABC transporter permease subunit [Caldilineaceae bacterium]MBP8121444.1 ABC transporter permease subunit [Caldilineaceae bacterium]MBP9073699.1 ABC transporter permease subunit [Caldilineaceae bacterium]